MKRFIAILALGAALTPVAAQEELPPEKDTRNEGKYLQLVDADKAYQLAQETGKRILVYQDWPL